MTTLLICQVTKFKPPSVIMDIIIKKGRSLVNDTVELTCWFSFYLANTFEPHLEWMISSVIQVSA